MKRWIHAEDILSATDLQLPKILQDKKITFTLQGTNPDWNDDILRIAENHGAIKVKYDTINPKTGKFWPVSYWKYTAPSIGVAEDILNSCLEANIPLKTTELINVSEADWGNCYNIKVDDYDKGIYNLNYYSKRR